MSDNEDSLGMGITIRSQVSTPVGSAVMKIFLAPSFYLFRPSFAMACALFMEDYEDPKSQSEQTQ